MAALVHCLLGDPQFCRQFPLTSLQKEQLNDQILAAKEDTPRPPAGSQSACQQDSIKGAERYMSPIRHYFPELGQSVTTGSG